MMGNSVAIGAAFIAIMVGLMCETNTVTAATPVLTKYVFSSSEINADGARCLDGAGSGFYYGNATNSENSNKWFILLQGGGFCVAQTQPSWPNIQNCAARLKTALGTSSAWTPTRARMDSPVGSTFNQIFVPYCGGDLHAGTRLDAVNGMWSAGHLTIAAIIKKLKLEANFDDATEILLAGESAGGIGVFTNANYLKSQISPKTTLRLFTNGGWFPSSAIPLFNPTYQGDQFKIIYDQVAPYLDHSCVADNTERPWDCFSGDFMFPHLLNPLFVANSIFDTNQLQVQNGVDSSPANNWADPYANEFIVKAGQILNNTLLQVHNANNAGMYITSDWVHVIGSAQYSLLMTNWYTGQLPSKFMDSRTTPNGATLPLPPPLA